MTAASNICSAEYVAGQAIVDSSCSGGTLVLRGICWPITDNSTGTTVDTTGVVKPGNIDATNIAVAHQPKTVWYDATNGNVGDVAGVNGTQANPVDNEAHMLSLATALGTKTLTILGEFVMTQEYVGYTFLPGDRLAEITPNGNAVSSCIFRGVRVGGAIDPTATRGNRYYDCMLALLTGFAGHATDCLIFGAVGFTGGSVDKFVRCSPWSASQLGAVPPALDFASSSTSAALVVSSHTGPLLVRNISVGMEGLDIIIEITGHLELEATCEVGMITVTGSGKLIDNSGAGCTVDTSGFIHTADTAAAGELATYSPRTVWYDEDAAGGGDGSEALPVNNLTDLLATASAIGAKTIKGVGSLTLDQDMVGFTFIGIAGTSSNTLRFQITMDPLSSADGCVFRSVYLKGEALAPSRVVAHDSIVVLATIYGRAFNCGMHAIVVDGELDCTDCYTLLAGTACEFSPAQSSSSLRLNQWVGLITFKGYTATLSQSLGGDVRSNLMTIDSSCTGGSFNFTGQGSYIDNSSGTAEVNLSGFLQVADIETALAHQSKTVWIDTTGLGAAGTVPGVNGTEVNPVDNVADMLLVAAAIGAKTIKGRGTVTLDRDVEGFEWIGLSGLSDGDGRFRPSLEGFSVDGCHFRRCYVIGDPAAGNQWDATDCYIVATTVRGTLNRCAIGSVSIDREAFLHECSPLAVSSTITIQPLTGVANTNFILDRWNGPLILAGFTLSTQRVTGTINTPLLTIENTCVDGSIILSGIGKLTDNSAVGCTVDSSAFIEATNINETHRLLALDPDNPVVRTPSTIDAGDISIDVVAVGSTVTSTRS